MTWRLGPYRVDDRPFAEGASAEVFRARDRRDGRVVAIKVLRLDELDPDVRARAEQEAAHAALDHPHVVRVHERVLDERRKLVGLVMDLAEGGDLRAALSGPTPPTAAEMVGLVDDILAGLGALHAAGIVHRDVKPENVLLDVVGNTRRARLGDLGIARAVDRTRSTGSVLGTDLYIAPEVHEGATPSVTSDIWAVGYVLYEGLFGGPPHASSATAYQAIGRLRTVGADRPPDVPDDVWRVVAAMLAPSPEERPATADDARQLVARLGSIVATASAPRPEVFGGEARPRAATPTSVPAPIGVPRRTLRRPAVMPERRPRRGARPAAVLTLVATVLATVQWLGRDREPAPIATAPASAVRALTPLAPDAAGIVPTQYQWTVSGNQLVGHLDVANQTQAPSSPAAIPELFPAGARRAGRLMIVGPARTVDPRADGSTLASFSIPALAPGDHHVVRFTVTLPAAVDPDRVLAQLARARDEAVARHALLRSDAPTLGGLLIREPPGPLAVGQQVKLDVAGRLTTGADAPPGLIAGLRWSVVEGASVELVDGVVTARQPGSATVSAAVGAVEARLTVTVLVPPARPATTRTRRQRTTGPPSTVIIEEHHEDPPPPHESFLVMRGAGGGRTA